jgi:hypothetical protein
VLRRSRLQLGEYRLQHGEHPFASAVESIVKAGDLLFASGYKYEVDGTEMFEFHVDESKK